jgi:hypothetical protein
MIGIEEFTPEFFDKAQEAWRSNKKYLGKGWFAYRCKYIHFNTKQCPKAVWSGCRGYYTTIGCE